MADNIWVILLNIDFVFKSTDGVFFLELVVYVNLSSNVLSLKKLLATPGCSHTYRRLNIDHGNQFPSYHTIKIS